MIDDNDRNPTQVSDRALEMVMRDVLDGMLELSLETAYSNRVTDFEIIEIAPQQSFGKRQHPQVRAQKSNSDPADILPFPQLRKAAC